MHELHYPGRPFSGLRSHRPAWPGDRTSAAGRRIPDVLHDRTDELRLAFIEIAEDPLGKLLSEGLPELSGQNAVLPDEVHQFSKFCRVGLDQPRQLVAPRGIDRSVQVLREKRVEAVHLIPSERPTSG